MIQNYNSMQTEPTNSTLAITLEYIKKDIIEIKSDVKDIKSEYVLRREFQDKLLEQEERMMYKIDSLNERISVPLKAMYATASTVGLAVLYTILKLIHL